MPIVQAVLLFTWLGFTPTAHADAESCVACCKASGLAGCSTRLKVIGTDSQARAESGGWRIEGAWTLDCTRGARFDHGTTLVIDHRPVEGEVMTVGMPDSAVRCFNQGCSLPAQGCLAIEPSSARSENPTWFLGHCEENRTLTDTEYTRAGEPGPIGARAVRVGDRTLIAQPIRGPSIIGSRVIGSSEEPSGQAPKTLRAWGAPEQVHTEISLDLPDAPPANCSTPVPLQEESRRQVNLGDTANNGGDVQQAIDQYRAAISLYPCNGLAWAALGKVALSRYEFSLGVAALETATRLRPDHYGAFTNLGLAYEELGETQRAEQAFNRALDLQPGHPAALEGLRRVH